MPSYKVHGTVALVLIGSLIAGAVGCGFLTCAPHLYGWIALWALVGGLFPDIDTKSKIQRPFYCLVLGLMLWCWLLRKEQLGLGLAVVSLIPLIGHHRGLMHSNMLYLVVALAAWGNYKMGWLPEVQGVVACMAIGAFALGAIIHIQLDRW